MRILEAVASALALFLIASPAFAAAPQLSAADQQAAFKAAGFTLHGKSWRSACDDPDTASYTPGTIETVSDLNGDGRLEAVVTEGSSYCYGMAGTAFSIVSKQANGRWKVMTSGTGIVSFLPTKGAGGWPDIEIGGPGFCFPVQRWNGREYRLHGYQYEGKICKPS
jgi:hypothetical protein